MDIDPKNHDYMGELKEFVRNNVNIKQEPQDDDETYNEVVASQSVTEKQKLSIAKYKETRGNEFLLQPVASAAEPNHAPVTTHDVTHDKSISVGTAIYDGVNAATSRDPRGRIGTVKAADPPPQKPNSFIEGGYNSSFHPTFSIGIDQSEAAQKASKLRIRKTSLFMDNDVPMDVPARSGFRSDIEQCLVGNIPMNQGIDQNDCESDEMPTPIRLRPGTSSVNGSHPTIPERQFVSKEVQTTPNDGFFSINLDMSTLSREEREALKVFKKAMSLRHPEDMSTGGILERLRHRRANNAFYESQNGNQPTQQSCPSEQSQPSTTNNTDLASTSYHPSPRPSQTYSSYETSAQNNPRIRSNRTETLTSDTQRPQTYGNNRDFKPINVHGVRDLNSSWSDRELFINPPAPSPQPPKKSKYANAIPK